MMVELTEERVRQIVREEIREPLDQLERRFYEHINDGFDRVLEVIQSLNDQKDDDLAGMDGKFRSHNQRIARLERLNDLR
ncbi:MAG: hypothetical protein JWN01_833 [Patescibacteria group bacterium]|nr:hypothetical protein [Patescibacteria group bacterium]